MGMVSGMPMRSAKLRNLMQTMNQPKVVYTKPDEGKRGRPHYLLSRSSINFRRMA